MLERLKQFKQSVKEHIKDRVHPEAEIVIDCQDYAYFRNFELSEFVEFEEQRHIDEGCLDMKLSVRAKDDYVLFQLSIKSFPDVNQAMIVTPTTQVDLPKDMLSEFTKILVDIFDKKVVIYQGVFRAEWLKELSAGATSVVVNSGLFGRKTMILKTYTNE